MTTPSPSTFPIVQSIKEEGQGARFVGDDRRERTVLLLLPWQSSLRVNAATNGDSEEDSNARNTASGCQCTAEEEDAENHASPLMSSIWGEEGRIGGSNGRLPTFLACSDDAPSR